MIELNNEIVTPTIESKTYDTVWIKNIGINAPNPGTLVEAYITVVPMNSSTGELLESNQQTIILNDVFTECALNETLAQAMEAIFSAVQHLVTTRNVF